MSAVLILLFLLQQQVDAAVIAKPVSPLSRFVLTERAAFSSLIDRDLFNESMISLTTKTSAPPAEEIMTSTDALSDTSLVSALPTIDILTLTTTPQASNSGQPEPYNVCDSVASDPANINYTQPYHCTLKSDYAILGLYYDTCKLVNLTAAAPSNRNMDIIRSTLLALPSDSASSAAKSKPSRQASGTSEEGTLHIFCCNPAFSQPDTFDTLCVWGNGTNIAAPDAVDPKHVARPADAPAQCFVSPIIHPKARCIQVP